MNNSNIVYTNIQDNYNYDNYDNYDNIETTTIYYLIDYINRTG